MFGHKTPDCTNVGKILSVLDLKDNHPGLCKRILQTHIQKNDPEKRLAIIRSLQAIDVIPRDREAEECLLDETYHQTVTHTVNIANTVFDENNM